MRHARRRDFNTVSTAGLESSPIAAALAGLRAHEARYLKLSDGMEPAAELALQFTFARQKAKLVGTIRGSYFAFKNDY